MRLLACLFFGAIFSLFPLLSVAEGVDTSDLSRVDENTATLTIDGVEYVFNTYIVPFRRPYHIQLKRSDGAPIEKAKAVEISKQYIEPRGCTDPLERRPKLDQKNSDKTKWVIGIAC